MMGIIRGRLLLLRRKPGGFIATTVICIVFAFILGKNSFSKMEVPVYSSLPSEEISSLLKELNKSENYDFKIKTEKEVKEQVADGKAEVGLELLENDFGVYRASHTQSVQLINQYVSELYIERLQKQTIISMSSDKEGAKKIVEASEENPIFNLDVSSYKNQNEPIYNQALQSLFGFTLFFSIYTISFNVVEILKEKQERVWDRFILSPTSKTSVYLANLLYSFFIGYFQIALIFMIFRYGAGVDFNGGLGKTLVIIIPYLFAIVALSIFLTGIVKTMAQFNAVIPLVGVSFAMLGGAYWPIEIVSSKIILAISKVVPITYGMELLKGVTTQGLPISELLYPITILILMGVVLMGLGIRMIERRHV